MHHTSGIALTATSRAAGAPRAFGSDAPLTPEELARAPVAGLRLERLARPLTDLPGAGAATARAAARLGIETVGDLLEHLPWRYQEQAPERTVATLAVGEEATLAVEVKDCRVRPTRRRNLKLLECHVADASGPMTAVWFNQVYLARQLQPGTRVLLRGTFEGGRKGTFRVKTQEVLPPAEGAGPAEGAPAAADAAGSESPAGGHPGLHTLGLVPVYPATEGLGSRKLRELAWAALGDAREAPEPLPAALRARLRLPLRSAALAAAHFPARDSDAVAARRRLAFEELYLLQVAIAARRRARDEGRRAEPLPSPGEAMRAWAASLPFELTPDQRAAVAEIDADLASERPMQRLLMGEVGSGKTVVALHTMLRAAESGGQAVLMAPTETLAEQHFATLERLAGGVPVRLLTGATPPAREREALLATLASGQQPLLVATHAVLEEPVRFERLAVAVVDEQHRFGVRQRQALEAKAREGTVPHVLHLTATPIPRTLRLTRFGDLDTTALKGLPAGRPEVKTYLVPEGKRPEAYGFIREQLRAGRQAFVVCPLVEESEQLQARAATREGERLAATEFPDFRVEVLHGQMPARAKQERMAAFASGAAGVLVATSVVEVGIDVPNATVMVIEDADRYGLSQLHQLRGRVGRGTEESHCMLFADPKTDTARRRLEALAASRDGFRLAQLDLELRGEGEILGARQHGSLELRVATLPGDEELLATAAAAATELIVADPRLEAPEHDLLRAAVLARYGGTELDPIPA